MSINVEQVHAVRKKHRDCPVVVIKRFIFAWLCSMVKSNDFSMEGKLEGHRDPETHNPKIVVTKASSFSILIEFSNPELI